MVWLLCTLIGPYILCPVNLASSIHKLSISTKGMFRNIFLLLFYAFLVCSQGKNCYSFSDKREILGIIRFVQHLGRRLLLPRERRRQPTLSNFLPMYITVDNHPHAVRNLTCTEFCYYRIVKVTAVVSSGLRSPASLALGYLTSLTFRH